VTRIRRAPSSSKPAMASRLARGMSFTWSRTRSAYRGDRSNGHPVARTDAVL
jgi:hypothetical protein